MEKGAGESRLPFMFRRGVVCPEDQDPPAWLQEYYEIPAAPPGI
jgi:hypothetical protein